MKRTQSAFTLLEMSIVVLMIGILVGAVLGAQNMVFQSKLTRVIGDLTGYKNSFDSFVLKYNALPGDMNDASTTFKLFTGTGTFTIRNGNGNGVIEHTAVSTTPEATNVFNHMSMAGFVKGKYGTNTPAGGNIKQVGYNFPAGPHTPAVYYIVNAYENFHSVNATTFAEDAASFTAKEATSNDTSLLFSNSIFYISYDNSGNRGILTPSETASLDAKMDDGKYYTGRFSGIRGKNAAGACSDGGTGYAVDDTNQYCGFVFSLDQIRR